MINEIIRHLGEHRALSTLNLELIDDLVAHWRNKQNSNATINRKLSILSKASTFAEQRGWLQHKPKIEWQKEGKGRMRFVSEDEEAIMYRVLTQMGYFRSVMYSCS